MSGSRWSLPLAVLAVLAVSSSAVLARWADAPPEALAFWRTLGGAILLAPLARRAPRGPDRGQWRAIVVAGLALAVHFATWLASLELTTVAASVTLVTTAPLLIAVGWALAGRRPPTRTWLAIALALVGVVIITVGGGPAGGSGAGDAVVADGSGDGRLGAGLALTGAAAMAIYLVAGDRVRKDLPTAAYAARAYAVAALALGGYAAAADVDLVGYDPRTWLAIAGMVLGPQLAGHTVLNLLLQRLGSISVSTLLLAEPVGAGLLVWLLLGEVPPLAAWVGGPLVLGAVALQIRTIPVTDAGRLDVGRPGLAG